MKFLVFVALSATLLMSCKKDEKKPTPNPTPTPVTEEGSANITLTLTNGEVYQIAGPCGWAVAGGSHYIGANHSSNNLKTFSTFFNISELPAQTTTYTLVDDQLDEDPSHIWMNITEMVGSSWIEWTSHDASGNLTLVVQGNKVTVDLAGIVLENGSSNASPYNANGTLSGTLTFYK
jgi:hypothetical protein